MLLALASAKGSPGVTSTALALGAAWPRPVIVVEADPSGGSIGYRAKAATGGPLSTAPNLLGLATAARSGTGGQLSDYSQQLACGVEVIVGVDSARQGRGLATLWADVASLLSVVAAATTHPVDVLVDLGRLDTGSPVLPLVAAAERLLLVTSASLEGIVTTRNLASELVEQHPHLAAGGRLGTALVGPSRHLAADLRDVDQVMAAASVPVAPGVGVPHDGDALRRLEEGEAAGRLAKTSLFKAVGPLAERIAGDSRQEVRFA